jgi:hypothetical protein
LQVLTDRELIKLFDGLVKYYQESATYDQKSAKGFVNPTGVDYETLAADYDTWDIPDLFRRTFNLLNEKLNNLIAESMQYQNASYQLSLRGIAKDLDTWEQTRLEALEAITYRGRLVRNRDVIAQRIQYQLQNLDIQIRQKSQDATENLQLLAVIEQPKALAGNRETSPILDSSAIDRFVKSDYVRPVVERISRLQEEVQTLQADKARLDNQLSWLPKSTDPIANSLPPGYKSLTTTISREINAIIQNYDRLLENYLTATITSMVTIKQAPVISREVYSPARALPAIALFSMFLAVMLLGIEYLFKKARATRKQRQPAHNQPMSHS